MEPNPATCTHEYTSGQLLEASNNGSKSDETKPSNVFGTSTRAVNCSKLPITVQKVGFQNREDDPQRKRVAQRTLLVREHTQAFDGEAYSMSNALRQHIHRYQSPLFELPLKDDLWINIYTEQYLIL